MTCIKDFADFIVGAPSALAPEASLLGLAGFPEMLAVFGVQSGEIELRHLASYYGHRLKGWDWPEQITLSRGQPDFRFRLATADEHDQIKAAIVTARALSKGLPTPGYYQMFWVARMP